MSDVVFVGTSDAFGAGGRRQSAIFVRGDGGAMLLDCGGTTNTGLAALGIERNEIDAIAVSHFHADHFGGIPLFLLAALYEDQRKHPLTIAGPPGIEGRVRAAAIALGHDLSAREWPFRLDFVELPEGSQNRVGPVRIKSFETRHNRDAHPHGMRVDLGREELVYSGDTGWFDGLPQHVAGAQLFVCECTLLQPDWEFHLSLEELLERKDQFDCGRMILTHLGPEMAERRGDCEFETADDGLVIKI